MLEREALEKELALARQDRTALLKVLLRVEKKVTRIDTFARATAFGGPPGRVAIVVSAMALLVATVSVVASVALLRRIDDVQKSIPGDVHADRDGVHAENPR